MLDWIVDTHIHLQDEAFKSDLEEVIKRASEASVKFLITNATSFTDLDSTLEISSRYSNVYVALGIHPSEIKEDIDLTLLEVKLKNPKVVAIGEVGLDYYWDKTYKELQKKYFALQVLLAKKYNIPVIIHAREAIKDTLDILEETDYFNAVFHCYSGSLETARYLVKKGASLGIGGVLTFKNAVKLKEVVKEIPLTSLVLETDAPYLAPVPYRGKRNEPSYLREVVKTISELKGVSIEEVIKTTTNNALRIFKIGGEK